MYDNDVDLQLRNATPHRLGLNVWLSGSHLHGSLWTDAAYPDSFRIEEQDHRFYRRDDGQIYRANRLYQQRIDRRSGQRVERRLITENDARVMYVPTGIEIQDGFS